MSRVGLVTALLPPAIGGTEILVWRLFQGEPQPAIVSGAPKDVPPTGDLYAALPGPTLHLPYPRLRGYRYGLAPILGAVSAAWLAAALPRVVRFLERQGVDHVVSIPHQGPFALLGLLAARRLGLSHTLYVLDAWEEGLTGPVERWLIELGLRLAAHTTRSRLAAVSPTLAAHYRTTFGFRDVVWIPNPAPLPAELPTTDVVQRPVVVFSGGIKPFNSEAVRCAARAIRHCRVAEKLIVTGPSFRFSEALQAAGELHDRVEFRLGSRTEVAATQREASVLLIATNIDDTSLTSRGYLPGRLPEYVAAGRRILLIGPDDSDAARAVRHWNLGLTTATGDERLIAGMLDCLATSALASEPATANRDAFLELFSRSEARRRLLSEPARELSADAAALAEGFELPLRAPHPI